MNLFESDKEEEDMILSEKELEDLFGKNTSKKNASNQTNQTIKNFDKKEDKINPISKNFSQNETSNTKKESSILPIINSSNINSSSKSNLSISQTSKNLESKLPNLNIESQKNKISSQIKTDTKENKNNMLGMKHSDKEDFEQSDVESEEIESLEERSHSYEKTIQSQSKEEFNLNNKNETLLNSPIKFSENEEVEKMISPTKFKNEGNKRLKSLF